MAEKKVLALVISDLGYGGAEQQVVQIANNLDPSQFDVHVISLSSDNPRECELRNGSATFHAIPRRWKFDPSPIWRLAKLERNLNVDIAHGFLQLAETFVVLASLLFRTPNIILSERNSNYRTTAIGRFIKKLCLTRSDMCIANSYSGMTFSQRTYKSYSTRYRVVQNGVDCELFSPKEDLRFGRTIGLNDSDFVVGVFASLKPQKNHKLFFTGLAEVLRRRDNVKALVVGGSPYLPTTISSEYEDILRHYVDELGIAHKVLWLGPRHDVVKLYNLCHVTVLTSVHEGLPNSILESMACGVPVIATDVSDNSTLVDDGTSGFIIDPEDHGALAARLLFLFENRQALTDMGRAARERMSNEFSNAVMLMRLQDCYSELVNSPQRDSLAN